MLERIKSPIGRKKRLSCLKMVIKAYITFMILCIKNKKINIIKIDIINIILFILII